MCEHLLVLHYLFNTFLSNFIQPSITSRQLKQAQWCTTATRGQQWKPTSCSTLFSHFWREYYQYRPLQLLLSAFSARAVSSWNRIMRDLAKKLLCQLVFLKCNINVWPLNVWCNGDIVWHCIDWATIVVKIQNRIQQVICCFTVVRSLLFLTGEWIGLLRPRLDLEKAWSWPWGYLALASNILSSNPSLVTAHV